jgi:diadenosine tetraphosphate (Ap4A) HIT family hydrolase
MLIRWATKEEKLLNGYTDEEFGKFDVLVAVDRMTEKILGILGFSRENNKIGEVRIFDFVRGNDVKEKLILCAERQCNPIGYSFHYRYPVYEKETNQKFCPCCNNEPQPDGLLDIAELEHSWVTAERVAQGKLFGKCHVLCKKHYVHIFEMTKDDLLGFMTDIQKAAKALQEVTGAIKINYEIHGNTGPHLHCHLFPRYLDDDFPGKSIDIKLIEPSPYESEEEFKWFFNKMQEKLKYMYRGATCN